MSYDEVIALILPNVGRRVRVTWPNGGQKSGLVGMWKDRVPTLGAYRSGDRFLGGHLCGGEYAGAVRVEVMQENGRYAEVAG